jgi:hypothetical protein
MNYECINCERFRDLLEAIKKAMLERYADTARLDWLQAQRASLFTVFNSGPKGGTGKLRPGLHTGWLVGQAECESPTVREAIDRAMHPLVKRDDEHVLATGFAGGGATEDGAPIKIDGES